MCIYIRTCKQSWYNLPFDRQSKQSSKSTHHWVWMAWMVLSIGKNCSNMALPKTMAPRNLWFSFIFPPCNLMPGRIQLFSVCLQTAILVPGVGMLEDCASKRQCQPLRLMRCQIYPEKIGGKELVDLSQQCNSAVVCKARAVPCVPNAFALTWAA